MRVQNLCVLGAIAGSVLCCRGEERPDLASVATGIVADARALRNETEALLNKVRGLVEPAEEGRAGELRTAVEQRVREEIAVFTKAFDAHDAGAVAALWAPSGTYETADGTVYTGREEISRTYADLFDKYPQARCAVELLGVRIVNPSTVLEYGLSTLYLDANAQPDTSHYTATHVRQGDTWVLVNVQDLPAGELSQYDAFRDLDWLVGSWRAVRSNLVLTTEFSWLGDGFLERRWATTLDDAPIAQGLQIIGWDPASSTVNSWAFDSHGSMSSALWTPDDRGWSVTTHGTLVDGTPFAAAYRMRSVDENTLAIISHGRTVGGAALPELGEFELRRVTAQ